jgi:hypothetical protein
MSEPPADTSSLTADALALGIHVLARTTLIGRSLYAGVSRTSAASGRHSAVGAQAGVVWLTRVPMPLASGSPGYS